MELYARKHKYGYGMVTVIFEKVGHMYGRGRDMYIKYIFIFIFI